MRDDAAFVHHKDAIAVGSDVLHAVRNHDDGEAAGVKIVDKLQELRTCSGVESGNRLIEHQHTGAHGEHAGKGATTLLTSGEGKGAFLCNLIGIKAYELESLEHAFGDLLGRQAKVLGTKGNVLKDRVGKELVLRILKHHADGGLCFLADVLVLHADALEQHTPLRGVGEAVHVLDDGRFTRAGVARNAEHLAFAYIKGDVTQGPDGIGVVAPSGGLRCRRVFLAASCTLAGGFLVAVIHVLKLDERGVVALRRFFGCRGFLA